MELLITIGVLALLGALLFAWNKQRRAKASAAASRGKSRAADGLDTLMSWHPQATRILTVSERKAYLALRTGLPDHIILAQVPLARFLKVPTRHSYAEWLRRVGVMCADIVVCDSASQVIAVVDVRAPESRENDRARQRHARMDRVLQGAEIPLHVWREDALPTPIAARNAILKTSSTEMPPAGTTPPTMNQAVRHTSGASQAGMNGDDTGMEMTDPPSSTWFDDLDSAAAPLSPIPPRRGPGPSIR